MLTAIAWGIREMIPPLKKRWMRGRVKKAKAGYEAIGETLDALDDGRRGCGASRAVFLVSRNSGGIPGPGVPVKVSVRYEQAGDETRRIHADFQDWFADGPYCDLLAKVAASGGSPVQIHTANLQDGVLKNLYLTDGIVGSEVFLLGHVPNGNWMAYVSFNFKDGDIVHGPMGLSPSPEQSEAMRASVTRMRNTLSDSHDILI